MKKYFFVVLLSNVFLFGINVRQSSACFAGSPSDTVNSVYEYNLFVRDYNRAEAIFMGEMTAIDRFRVKFKVLKVWKGNLPSDFVMSTGAMPRDKSDVVTISSCDYGFSLGETYLVYARKQLFLEERGFFEERYGKIPAEYKALLWTSKSSRTRMLKEASLGISNLDKLTNNKSFQFKRSNFRHPLFFKPAGNRRANS